MIFSKAQKQLK
ncbi:MAG: hypothetical protein KAZ87_13470 [Spirochaetes bacterium]|nr:hypothetical protein [Spirochaetota bacterium]